MKKLGTLAVLCGLFGLVGCEPAATTDTAPVDTGAATATDMGDGETVEVEETVTEPAGEPQ